MIKEKRTISPFIEKLLPQYIKDYFPNFCEFIRNYFKYLEKDGNVYDILVHLFNLIDVDKIDKEYLNKLISEYLVDFPIEQEYFNDPENKRFFIKNIKNFYKEKGNLISAKFIFNILNHSIEIYYPKEKIFYLNKIRSKLNDSQSVFHDNYYYAYYVYEIKTDLDLKDWKQIAYSTFHPLGMKCFSKKPIEMQVSYVELDKWKDCKNLDSNYFENNNLKLYKKEKDFNIICCKRNIIFFITNKNQSYFILNKKTSKLNADQGNKKFLKFINKSNFLEGESNLFYFLQKNIYFEKINEKGSLLENNKYFDYEDLKNISYKYLKNIEKNLQKNSIINLY